MCNHSICNDTQIIITDKRRRCEQINNVYEIHTQTQTPFAVKHAFRVSMPHAHLRHVNFAFEWQHSTLYRESRG